MSKQTRVGRRGWRSLLAAVAVVVVAGCGDGGAGDFEWGRAPSWTPDGTRLVYSQNLSTPSDQITTSVRALDAGLVFSIGVDGTGVRQLTPDDRGPDFFPVVSPDGTRIAFASGETRQFEIFIANLDGSSRRQLTFDEAADTTPAWSPDGRAVAFVSDRTGNSDIWLIQTDGSGLRQLTSFPSDEASPAFSPDGTQIAFASNLDRSNFDLWIMDADGGNLRQLTRKDSAASRIADGGPTWSPDGRQLAFERWDDNWDVWRIDADGSNLTRLTTDDQHDGDPAWSPDGSNIAFTSARSGWWQVWLMNPDGTGQRQLTGRGD